MTSQDDERLSALIRDGLRHLEQAESGDEDDYFDFATEVGNAINAFKEATKLAPDEPWLGYYNWVGMCFVNGWSHPYDKRWFEHGAKWASDDTDYETLFVLFTHLGGAYAESTPPDYLAAYKSLQQAYSYLIGMPDRDWGYSYWLSHISQFNAWDPGDDWPIFQQILDLALDQTPFRKSLTELDGNLTLVDFAETGARMALKRGERQVAIGYLLQAQNLDPTHITIAKLLAEVYLDEKRWSKALQELRKVSAIDPADEQAVRLIPVLELAQEGTLNKQSRDLILTVLPDLRAGQEMILDELSLQRDLMQRVADAQNRAQIELGQPRNEERAYAELFDQLHRLVQEGSRIQPAAWHSARSRLVDKLGSEVYGSLQGTDSQHFLITAEVFFTASRDVKAMTDAAPIAVEYAKVVETELKDRFLSDLGTYLDLKKHVQGLRCGSDIIGKQQAGSWKVAMKKLGLGQVGYLLMSTAEGVNDSALGEYLKSRDIRRDLVHSIGENVLKIAGKYRNGAAHTHSLTRGDLEEFRELLFERETGLLYRLVELGRRVEAIRINQ